MHRFFPICLGFPSYGALDEEDPSSHLDEVSNS